ncbi:MAG: hypothetical protein EDX89_04990 [Acidobacteria bacterium]|nr:MAG: hypothetical protein EDX89_04990 [Acidobacteriota bacterium]MCE7958299.1 hypothetical protein [Acidobacteria bacterium ACB2]
MLARKALAQSELVARLVGKGFDPDEAVAVAGELSDRGWAEHDAGRLAALLERRVRALPAGLTPGERAGKLFDHLVRRGFPEEAVLDALRKKGFTDDDLR